MNHHGSLRANAAKFGPVRGQKKMESPKLSFSPRGGGWHDHRETRCFFSNLELCPVCWLSW